MYIYIYKTTKFPYFQISSYDISIVLLLLITDGIRYVIVVEHDLSVLDYLSDFICCLYGTPGAYGVVTLPFSVREGNTLLRES